MIKTLWLCFLLKKSGRCGRLPAHTPLRTVRESFPSFRLKPLSTGAPDMGTRRQSNDKNEIIQLRWVDCTFQGHSLFSGRARQNNGASRSIRYSEGRRGSLRP